MKIWNLWSPDPAVVFWQQSGFPKMWQTPPSPGTSRSQDHASVSFVCPWPFSSLRRWGDNRPTYNVYKSFQRWYHWLVPLICFWRCSRTPKPTEQSPAWKRGQNPQQAFCRHTHEALQWTKQVPNILELTGQDAERFLSLYTSRGAAWVGGITFWWLRKPRFMEGKWVAPVHTTGTNLCSSSPSCIFEWECEWSGA